MKQETYNKLEDIIHALYNFTSMIDNEAKESAMGHGGCPGDIIKINTVVFRIISDLKTTKTHMYNIDRFEKMNEKMLNRSENK